jgi:hypothetical protein
MAEKLQKDPARPDQDVVDSHVVGFKDSQRIQQHVLSLIHWHLVGGPNFFCCK